MYLEFILLIILCRYLRKYLQTETSLSKWNKPLFFGMVFSIAMLIVEVILGDNSKQFTFWIAEPMLFTIVYLALTKKEFRPARPIIYAILPLIVVFLISNVVGMIDISFRNKWENYFDATRLFAFIWMGAMLIINNKQRKALEKERLKTLEREKEIEITERLKSALEVQVTERTAALTQQKEELQFTLDELKATQGQLIQSEKMASLGELTAGIAHEIQNPLNFVNNFSEVNAELIAEMKQEIEKGNLEEVKAIADDIAENEKKINHHGKRADAIVKGMLQHSRSSNGQKELTNINVLADEYLRLAYHGLRARDKSFNAAMKTNFDENMVSINIISQDIGRVLLNLITNAFHAVTEKKKEQPVGYEPAVTVGTKALDKVIEVIVSDNGKGIPPKLLDKIFQPFFTTKPTGQGTGLGLSLSYDIIKAHGGDLKVETKENEFAKFIIQLPVP